MVRIGVVGTGALGRHHVRLLRDLEGAELVGLHDKLPERARAVSEEFGVEAWPTLEALRDRVEAVVLAVPTVDHCRIGCDLLERGLHVLVEKPIAASLEEADRLLAAAGDRVLAVGHVEFYNPAVQALLAAGGPPRYVEIQRLGIFTQRSLDIDVILDLMIHDLQILHALDGSEVREVRATGVEVLSDRVDIANARIALASGCTAQLTASRVSGERVRKLRVFQGSRYYSVDYHDQEIKGYRLEDGPEGRRIQADDLVVDKGEPLRRELEAFIAACGGVENGHVDGRQGRQALETALQVAAAVRDSGGADE